MTTHEDRKLGQKIMKPLKGPMIPGKEGMPQHATCRGRKLDQKANNACGRPDALGEGGMPHYVTVNKLSCEMTQNYYTLQYVQSSCNEKVQPHIGNAKQDHVS